MSAATGSVGTSRSSIRTILGTWTWDADADVLGPAKGAADLWWEIHDETRRSLVLQNGAQAALVPDLPFEGLTATDIALMPMMGVIPGAEVAKPGTVIALRTSEGAMAKLRVRKLYTLNDLTFAGADDLSAYWRQFYGDGAAYQNYHLEIEFQILSR